LITEKGLALRLNAKGAQREGEFVKVELQDEAGRKVRVKIAIRGINPRRWEMARVEVPWFYACDFVKV